MTNKQFSGEVEAGLRQMESDNYGGPGVPKGALRGAGQGRKSGQGLGEG